MEQTSILNQEQRLILHEFAEDGRLSSNFYFTGGTALSEVYFQHRKSIDLDFFAKEQFDPQAILEVINSWSKKYNFSIQPRFIDPTHIYILTFETGRQLKIDFARYPYKSLDVFGQYHGINVDSLFDIAVNKLLTVNQRNEVKDFVDLYFILDKFNFWQLRDGVKQKFNVEIEPYLMAVDFMKVEDFEILPKMLKKLSLDKLKDFYRKQAEALSKSSISH